ncbi:nitronate monooxygenase family protein [Yinghuangia sp. ASG 101]|uniref:NAD(P)H-dependent flavin oxidoreductase n=1 Tax=Yinghuangia sp. ASG 101 TaxID=2896848 RepID=UPI001E4D2C5A|nr:nitronate monooxygenase family protein [Yinghuangia sp. ASG 101]UGQ09311.1 nitronate monooxygenase family protein [Yinghuangia sp. ASG 101]
MKPPICEKLGIEFPIFAFSHCRDVVAAVSRAGGFGVLGALAYSPDQLEIELAWIDEHVDGRPYGVDLAIPMNYLGKGGGDAALPANLEKLIPEGHLKFVDALLDEHGIPPLPQELEGKAAKAAGLNVDLESRAQIDVALGHPLVRMFVNALGPPPADIIDACHAKNVLVGALCGSPRHALKQVAAGVDVVVAQGTEAGGHCGEISTMVLIPQVVDAVGPDVPVLAAGGIGNGRQMAAALALGAQGAWTGSIWLTVAEADTHETAVQNILAATSADTVRSRSMTGKPARLLRTAWTDAWADPANPDPLPMPLQGLVFNKAARRFMRTKNKELNGWPAGQVIGAIDRVRPTQEVVLTLVQEWVAATERLGTLLADD